MSERVDWRSIRCANVDWDAAGLSRRAARLIRLACLPPDNGTGGAYGKGPWHDKTLGEIADMGVRAWRRTGNIHAANIGDAGVTIIMTIIDMAAEGKRVTNDGPAQDAYVPKCERAPEDGR